MLSETVITKIAQG